MKTSWLLIAVKHGVPAGALAIGGILAGLSISGGEGLLASVWFGYLVMLVALSLIFVGIKRYRDHEQGGVISFKTGLVLGLGVALVAALAYIAGWEIYLAATDYAFANEYAAGVIQAKQEAGMAGEALAAEIAAMEAFKEQYASFFFRAPMTFLEIFPVGLVVSLVSAAILKNPMVLPMRG